MKKRILSLLLSLGMVITTLVGCGSKELADKEEAVAEEAVAEEAYAEEAVVEEAVAEEDVKDNVVIEEEHSKVRNAYKEYLTEYLMDSNNYVHNKYLYDIIDINGDGVPEILYIDKASIDLDNNITLVYLEKTDGGDYDAFHVQQVASWTDYNDASYNNGLLFSYNSQTGAFMGNFDRRIYDDELDSCVYRLTNSGISGFWISTDYSTFFCCQLPYDIVEAYGEDINQLSSFNFESQEESYYCECEINETQVEDLRIFVDKLLQWQDDLCEYNGFVYDTSFKSTVPGGQFTDGVTKQELISYISCNSFEKLLGQ